MDRPRRATRPPARLVNAPSTSLPSAVSRPKRKTYANRQDPTEQLHFLLKHPKSPLTTIDISDLINATSWDMLSAESRSQLKRLLPTTAFIDFLPTIGREHPSASNVDLDTMEVDEGSGDDRVVDTAVFTDPHFMAAAHTLQDHIYSDWMSDIHHKKVKTYEEGIRDGTLAAPWKDEVWERSDTTAQPAAKRNGGLMPGLILGGTEASARAGEAAEIRLATLARNGVIRAGDVIAYRRNFSAIEVVVEKDVVIESIHPKTHTITVLFEPGTSKYLPSYLLSPTPEVSGQTQMASITSLSQLETALLDSDNRVDRSRRPHGNAWKCMTVWRWLTDAPVDIGDGRWGRENHGTLFYLRGTYYHER